MVFINSPRHHHIYPLALTWLRAGLGPTLVVFATFWPNRIAFAACLIAAFLSDVFDGVLARRLGVATPILRRLDSIADSIFYVCALWVVWRLHPNVILTNAALLAVLIALELIRYVFDWRKFGREASYHMWSSKLWGIALFVGFLSILVFESGNAFVIAAIVIGIAADVEGLLITMVLKTCQPDVPSIVHALRIRAGKMPTKSKNG
jgi:phosphatidylglycerophosphate synthase